MSGVTKPGSGVLSRTVISTIGMGVQGLARFVYTVVIGRLAAESLADVVTLLTLSVFASLFWPAAAGVAASRFLPERGVSSAARRLLRRSFVVSVVILGALSVPVALLLGVGWGQALGAAALVVSYSGYVFVRGVLFGEDRIVRATVVDTITSLVAISALVLVLIADWDWALLLPLAVSYTIFTLASWPMGGEHDSSSRREIFVFTRDSAVALLATGGLLQITMIFVKAFESDEVAKLFAASISLATPVNLVAQSMTQVLIPHFARMLGGPAQAIRASHLRVFLLSLAGFTVVFGLLMGLSGFILVAVFGDTYFEGALTMQLLLLAVGAMSAMAAPAAYLMATGRQRLYARIWLVFTIMGTLVMAVLTPGWGQWGAIIGFLGGAIGGSLAVIVSALVLPPREALSVSSGDNV